MLPVVQPADFLIRSWNRWLHVEGTRSVAGLRLRPVANREFGGAGD